MSGENLPEDEAPITPVEYWMESVAAWRDFSRDASSLWMSRMSKLHPVTTAEADPAEDTVTTDILRMMSDLNLRHWQNMARLLSGMPAWTHLPNTTTGSALVDWFDNMQRGNMTMTNPFGTAEQSITAPTPEDSALVKRPISLTAPEGSPDDLTRIKGIGPKLSSKLNDLGIYHFRQIAHWNEDEAAWVDDYLSFKGRVNREQWIAQAQSLSANGAGSLH